MSIIRNVKGDTLVLLEDGKEILSITEVIKDQRVNIRLDGSLKMSVEHDFLDEMMTFVILGFDLSIDFTNVHYLSSACVEVLLKIQQKMDDQGKGNLFLYYIPKDILDELKSTGMSELLDIRG